MPTLPQHRLSPPTTKKAQVKTLGLEIHAEPVRAYGPSLCGGVLAAFKQVTLGIEATVPPNT